jgi:hypothetical protein
MVFGGDNPTILCGIVLRLDNLGQHVTPGAPGDFWISHRGAGAGNLPVDPRLLLRFAFRVQHPLVSCPLSA